MADDGLVPGIGASGPARRTLLIASAAALPVLLTACRGVEALGTPPPPPTDVDTLRNAIEHEAALVASYAALTAAGGSAAPGSQAGAPGSQAGAAGGRAATALAVVLGDHRQHLAQLKSRLVEPAGHSSPAAGAATGRGGALETIAELEQAEQAASDRLIAQLAGLPPTLAQLFASIAASEATHVPYLKAARRGR